MTIFVKINYNKITQNKKKNEKLRNLVKKKKLVSSPSMRKQYFVAINLSGE